MHDCARGTGHPEAQVEDGVQRMLRSVLQLALPPSASTTLAMARLSSSTRSLRAHASQQGARSKARTHTHQHAKRAATSESRLQMRACRSGLVLMTSGTSRASGRLPSPTYAAKSARSTGRLPNRRSLSAATLPGLSGTCRLSTCHHIESDYVVRWHHLRVGPGVDRALLLAQLFAAGTCAARASARRAALLV